MAYWAPERKQSLLPLCMYFLRAILAIGKYYESKILSYNPKTRLYEVQALGETTRFAVDVTRIKLDADQ